MILFPIQNITQAYTEFRDFIANIVKQNLKCQKSTKSFVELRAIAGSTILIS